MADDIDRETRIAELERQLAARERELEALRGAVAAYTPAAEADQRLDEEIARRRDAVATAEFAIAARTRFLANMSHEIRTPLNGVIGMAELAQQLKLEPELAEYVDIIHQSAGSLLQIINNIMDVSRLDAGRFELVESSFELRSLVDGVTGAFRAAAARKGVQLNVAHEDAEPLHLRGDADRIAQVLTNLVGNALKFTAKGSVDVHVHTHRSGGASSSVTVSVKDTGIGIRPEDHERIFIMFHQSDDSDTRAFGGTGLGLAVCRGIAARLGGWIGVSSVYGQGATFIFKFELPRVEVSDPEDATSHLPAEVAPVAPEASVDPELADCPFLGLPVLLVEDNHVNRKLAVRILEKAGCMVDTAENGEVGVRLAASGRYKAIFMDCQMPIMDGYTATETIRAAEAEGERIPIIAVTANAMAGDREKCLECGMDDYVSKPIRPADLIEALTRWCEPVPLG